MPRHKVFDYDLIVIGTGSAGNVAANINAKKGKKVAIVDEAPRLGGECPNWGCVPTKALINAAEHYRSVKEAAEYGINITGVGVDYAKVRAWKNLAVKRTGTAEAEKFFNKQGINVIRGHGHFIDKHTLSVKGKRYHARKFLIATGTKSFIPPIKNLEEVGYVTYEEAIDFKQPPKKLAIVGGGAIGAEFAEIFSTFDSQVTVFEAAPRLLGREEPEVADLTKALMEKSGVTVHTGTLVERVESKDSKKVLHFRDHQRYSQLTVDEILIAAGKTPNTDIGLENAGVEYNRHGIGTNEFLQTTAKHIFAAGDVVGPYQFTHTASYQSRIAGNNLFSRKDHWLAADYHNVPRCVFVYPEVASVGITEQQVIDHGIDPKIGLAPISAIGRSNTENERAGLVKIVCNQKGTILGASIVAPRAGEMIHELSMAIQMKAHAHEVANMIHAFPTWSEAVRNACANVE